MATNDSIWLMQYYPNVNIINSNILYILMYVSTNIMYIRTWIETLASAYTHGHPISIAVFNVENSGDLDIWTSFVVFL